MKRAFGMTLIIIGLAVGYRVVRTIPAPALAQDRVAEVPTATVTPRMPVGNSLGQYHWLFYAVR